MAKFVHRDCTEDAIELFSRFVERHGFVHEVNGDAPVEVMWHIPAQRGLSLPITLGLQNWDELNFGVDDFWSYFFPFDDVTADFDEILEKWVAGDARVGCTGNRGRILQVKDGEAWRTVYKANTIPFFYRNPGAFVSNDPTHSNSTMT